MKNNMKNRIIATLLSLLLVATAAVPVMTSLLKPVEVGAYGEGDRENYTTDASGPAWYWSAYLLTHNNYGSYKPNYGTHPFDSIRTGAYSYYDDSDALRMTMSGGDLKGTRGYLHLSDATSDSNMNLSTWKYVGLLVRHDEDREMTINGRVYGSSAAGGQETQTLSASRNMQLIWFNAPSNGGNIDGLMLAFNGTIYIDSVIVATTTSIPTNLRWSEHGGYRITYNANGGTGAPDTQYGWKYATKSTNYTYAVTLSSTKPQRTGYTFQYWKNTAGGSENPGQDILFYIPTAQFQVQEHALTAVWAANTYTVSYNANGGSVSSDSKTVTYDSAYGSLPTPTRAGYTFDGWYTAASGGSQVTSSTKVTTAGNHTLYAHWTLAPYTVTYNANGGSVSPASGTVTYGSTYGSLPTPTRAGYTFDGWYTAASGGSQVTSSTTVSTAGNHILYAHWTPVVYNITYDYGYANPATVSNPASYTYGTGVASFNAPTRNGYRFGGWHDGSRIITSISNSSTGNVTLTAQWTTEPYTVTYNANGGTVTPASTGYNIESAAFKLATPTRNGYTFNGWVPAFPVGSWTAAKYNGEQNISTGAWGNVELVAQWTPIEYTVTYEPNGGTMAGTSGTFTVENGVVLPAAPTAPNGYEFAGWKITTAEGNWATSDTLYSAGDGVGQGTKYGNVTFTAQWAATNYAITLSVNNGILDGDRSIQYTIADAVILPTPTRDGHTFTGWKVIVAGGNWTLEEVLKDTLDAGRYGNVTLEAQWQSVGITVNYVVAGSTGGTLSRDTETVTPGATGQGSTANSTAGYKLVGWYTDAECTVPVNSAWVDGTTLKPVAGNEPSYTYYAKFDYLMVTLTITPSTDDTTYDDQSFIFTVTVTEVVADGLSAGEVVVAVIGPDACVTVDVPSCDYAVAERGGWNWRYTTNNLPAQGTATNENVAITPELIAQNKRWLNGYAYVVKKET